MRIKTHINDEDGYDRARLLRRNATPQEQKLWLALRSEAKKLDLKFRRQHLLAPYIVDFACPKAQLIVEVDGYSHDLSNNCVAVRDRHLKNMGYEVLHFMNEDVDKNLEGVVHVILRKAIELWSNKAPTPLPPPARGGGVTKG